jgi:oligopeptide/dipeptide ABC transporter ATP-binding protein
LAPLLQVEDLRISFVHDENVVTVIEDVNFTVDAGEVFGVVGESGCGKSVTALSIMRLLPPSARIESGRILFEGRDIAGLSPAALRKIRGNEISMIFQEPMTSLNAVLTVGEQIIEPLMLHQRMSRRQARDRAVEMLALVGIPAPDRRVAEYPHQLSGGMRQRVMIAIALACNPKLLIADEPTTALDVTIQAQILELLKELQEQFGMAVMIITHDLGVIAEFAREVMVMYSGRVVERAKVADIFERPIHPYTQGLLKSIPPLDDDVEHLDTIEGVVPSPYDPPSGCRFNPRCPHAREPCLKIVPPLFDFGDSRRAACIKPFDYQPAMPASWRDA